MAHVLFTNSMTPNIRPSQRLPARMANFAKKFTTTSMKQAVFPAARFLGLMVTFVLGAVTNMIAPVVCRKKLKAQKTGPFSTRLFTATIRQVSELVIRSLMPMANSLAAHSPAGQVRSGKNSAAPYPLGFHALKGQRASKGQASTTTCHLR